MLNRMKQPHLCFAIAGLCFGATPKGLGQPTGNESTSTAQSCTCQPCTTVDSTGKACPVLTAASQTKTIGRIRGDGRTTDRAVQNPAQARAQHISSYNRCYPRRFYWTDQAAFKRKRAIPDHSDYSRAYVYQHKRKQYLHGVCSC